MSKDKFYIISYEVYPFDVLVSYQKNFTDFKNTLKKKLPEDVHREINEFKGTYDGRTKMFSSGQTCIRFINPNESVVAHEVFHAVHSLMDLIGCNLTFDSGEAYAYLIGYLTKKIYDRK